ncbi:hypothetical protein [Bradyrhizobium sp. Rc3b]|uniref:hypothetical protein n=1 Tax=Bradyrhizobium sp. Rc3b TaxID=1855322 RepID=UPI0015A6AE20|nr:hypothetical protein [Bradyrhizobium sp. Rc3b]
MADTWAPALQRTAEEALRCVRGTRAVFGEQLSQRRHCERSEAIQTGSAEAVWIASSQGLLAMTECAVTESLFQFASSVQTRLRILAADLARAVLHRFTLD